MLQGGHSSPRSVSDMLGWIWKKGKASLKTLAELPQTSFYIPQLYGTKVPISIKKCNDPEKKLGVFTCPTGDFSHHAGQLVLAGIGYVERLNSRKLPAWDAWMGTRFQLFPKLIYGTVAVTHSHHKLEKAYQSRIW